MIVTIHPHHHSGDCACREGGTNLKSNPTTGFDLGVEWSPSWEDIRGPGNLDRGRTDGNEATGVGISGSSVVGRLETVMIEFSGRRPVRLWVKAPVGF